MRSSSLAPSVLPLVLALVGCGSAAAPEEQPPVVASAPGPTPIAKLVSRDRSITLLAGGGTVRVTVLDGNGRLIAHEVPLDDLQAIDATAFETAHGSFASSRLVPAVQASDLSR
jgi:hypothetical protein